MNTKREDLVTSHTLDHLSEIREYQNLISFEYLLVRYDHSIILDPGLTDDNADLVGFDLGEWTGAYCYKLSYWHPRVYLRNK
jgi:hypothetical protein